MKKIKKLFSNAMLSIVMDKQAKEKLQTIREIKKTAKDEAKNKAEPVGVPEAKEASSERAELIRNAMEVQRAQSKIFDNMSANDKKKIEAIAMKALMPGSDRSQKG